MVNALIACYLQHANIISFWCTCAAFNASFQYLTHTKHIAVRDNLNKDKKALVIVIYDISNPVVGSVI